ncbi:RHS repeat domain-containing protein [Cedecea sp. NFIX57]|uniref:RHS repeat domain-containing protein n=1 Tax=Cedecea sp. NFIX57 TaxID=1566286 RepID=UPI000A0CFFFA|nr:RHS repeat domain-containing protein [Cedecea sp. NFIX57]SMG61707.1 RHS repeat-associated core domain-containing protein [Cedecea sp. NFIX57]
MSTQAQYDLFRRTPTVSVRDNRGLTVREIQYHRHPDTPETTDERITRHRYDARGFLTQSADPRLHEAGLANFTCLTDLTGTVLRTESADAGTSVSLSDVAGRPHLAVTGEGVVCTWQYEAAPLPGRPLYMTEQAAPEAPVRIAERFVYAGNAQAEKDRNLAGRCVRHYDTAGLLQTDSIALTGGSLSVTRQLLKDADNPDGTADWQGEDPSVWNDRLDTTSYTTLTTADATGAVLTTTDAAGHVQRMVYDVAGVPSGIWLTMKESKEQAVVKSRTYSAAGQMLREEHGNGVVTTYAYEPQTQRLSGIRTERPGGHPSGAKVLQDLQYSYDPVGNVLRVTDAAEETRFWRNQKIVPENTYRYDSLYQLVSATGREMAGMADQTLTGPSAAVPLVADSNALTAWTRTYRYDTGGNLTRIQHSVPATGHRYTTEMTVSGRSNRAVLNMRAETSDKVDDLFSAGGFQKQLVPGQHLTWTPRGELSGVMPVPRDSQLSDSETYRYDAGRQRVLKTRVQKTGGGTRTQRTLYLPGLEIRTTKHGDRESELLQTITLGGIRVLRRTEGESGAGKTDDQIRYSHGDLTESCGLEVDGEGKVITREEYYPYGGTAVWTSRSRAEANDKTRRYSGKERDATGLYYYGYRYYQPWSGRWLSADPAGTVDGLNLFRMVQNNPLTLQDTDGLAPYRGQGDLLETTKFGPKDIKRRGLAELSPGQRDHILRGVTAAVHILDTAVDRLEQEGNRSGEVKNILRDFIGIRKFKGADLSQEEAVSSLTKQLIPMRNAMRRRLPGGIDAEQIALINTSKRGGLAHTFLPSDILSLNQRLRTQDPQIRPSELYRTESRIFVTDNLFKFKAAFTLTHEVSHYMTDTSDLFYYPKIAPPPRKPWEPFEPQSPDIDKWFGIHKNMAKYPSSGSASALSEVTIGRFDLEAELERTKYSAQSRLEFFSGNADSLTLLAFKLGRR